MASPLDLMTRRLQNAVVMSLGLAPGQDSLRLVLEAAGVAYEALVPVVRKAMVLRQEQMEGEVGRDASMMKDAYIKMNERVRLMDNDRNT